jgi:hypothetical protein
MQQQHRHRPRTGDEPVHARSALRARLVLASIGLANALIGVGIFGFWLHAVPFLVFFAVLSVAALVNIVVVSVRIRQGAHFQPGRDVPPYRPIETEPRPARRRRERASPHRRTVRYLVIMGTCVLLIVLAWVWVRHYSVLAAGVMSVIAGLLPPLAVIVTNADSPILRDEDEGEEHRDGTDGGSPGRSGTPGGDPPRD